MEEEWRPAFRYEDNYEVSNLGNIRSKTHWVNARNGGERLYIGKEINKRIRKVGYVECKICANSESKYKALHRIIAETFVPNPNGYKEVNHIDGNKQNNNASNLEWCTRRQNIIHSFEMGLNKPRIGAEHCNARFNDEDVLKIRELYKKGMKVRAISELYKVPKPTIEGITSGKSWKHLL